MPAEFVEIDSIEQLDELFERSNREPVALMKHSNRCGISSDILEQTSRIHGVINVVVIQEHRPISDAIAEKTGYRHQSPQAFVIRDGKPTYHATHYGISPTDIERCLND
jgi:bacillithiol system protein YtxJ